jgi:hypothetical protein
MLITFVLFGKFLEQHARNKTAGAIQALLRLQSTSATLVASQTEFSLSSGERTSIAAKQPTALNLLAHRFNQVEATAEEIDLRLVKYRGIPFLSDSYFSHRILEAWFI